MTKRWTRVWQNALLVIGSLLIAGSITEAGLRFLKTFEPSPRCDVGEFQDLPSRHFTIDAFTGWKMIPGVRFSWNTPEYKSSYSANSQGFRSPSDFLAAEPRRKIVVVGDSFTFGTGVEYNETFGAQLESALAGSVVYNLAMPGFGIDQMWLSIRHQALALHPALVIVGLCDADFSRSQTAYRLEEGRNKPAFKLLGGKLVPKTLSDHFNPLVHRLECSSHLWMAGRMLARWFGYYVPVGEWWNLNKVILDAIRTDGNVNHVPVLFMYIPTKTWRRFPTLQAYMDRASAHYIDLRANLPAPQNGLYYPVDGHFNPKGHACVAKVILTWINRNLPELSGGTRP